MIKELTQEESKKLNSEFMKAWPKLTESDMVIYKSSSNRKRFLDIVMQKQSIDKGAAEKRLIEIEAACGCSVITKAA
jgi:hypothetical protein